MAYGPIGLGLIVLGILVLADPAVLPWMLGPLSRRARLNRRVGGATLPAPGC